LAIELYPHQEKVVAEMRAGPTVNLKDLGKITLVVEHERPDDVS